jgi:hypothetical protein
VKQSSGWYYWIATSATPPRNDEPFWIAASATPLPRSARSWSLVAITEIRNAVIANEVKQSSKTMMHFV